MKKKLQHFHKKNFAFKKLFLLKIILAINIAFFFILLLSLNKYFKDLKNPDPGRVKAAAQKILENCARENRDTCYKDGLRKITADNGLSFGEQTLYALMDSDPILRNCHVYAHEISKAAVRHDPGSWEKLIEQVNVNICGAGFLHGIIEAHVGDDPNFEIDSNFINKTCYKNEHSFKERTCSHIFGHLLLVDSEGKIEPALSTCSKIDKSFKLDCYNGVFMEDSFKTTLVEHGLAKIPVRDEARMIRQRERCSKYTGEEGAACWTDLAEIFEELYNADASKVRELCSQAPYDYEREHCYFKAVILMAASPNYDDKDKLLSECTPYTSDSNLYKKCTDFILSSLMHYSPKFFNRGNLLCSNIEDSYKEFCFRDLGEKLRLNVTSTKEREEYCSVAPPQYKGICTGII